MIDPALIAKARALLNRARVIAEAPAAQFDAVGRGHPGSAPPFYQRSTLEQLHRRFVSAIASGENERVQAAIRFAEHELEMVTHGPSREAETPHQRRARILADYQGRHYSDVADLERLHKTYIWKIRIADGRDGVWGRKPSRRA